MLLSSYGQGDPLCKVVAKSRSLVVRIVYITYDLLSDYRGVAKWFGAHYNQEARFSSADEKLRVSDRKTVPK